MREYLAAFFEEFGYDTNDADALIAVYDKITSDYKTKSILDNILSEYEKNIRFDYEKNVFERTREISELLSIHNFTVDLLIFICMSKHLKNEYDLRKIDLQIYKDSMLDLKYKLDECKIVKGICGSFVAPWFNGFFDLTRFAFGRLQFEVIKTWQDYEKHGVKLIAGKSKVINVHIPRTGTPLDKESCDKAYARAREFFKDEVGENGAFVCFSWLMYPGTFNIIPKNSNTYRFVSEYDIIGSEDNDGDDLWRLFDTDEKNPDMLPCDTSMRRAFVDHIKTGGRLGNGFGVKI